MAEIVNDQRLQLILTSYGLDRIGQAQTNPSENLNLTKIKFGSGDNFEYYAPEENQESLKGPIPSAEFYVYNKELLEDETTISFHTIITEEIGGFDIREVGLYETRNGQDYLFAISTQQPFVKPSPDYNYFINLDYYMFIKDAGFAEVYDQITLDVEHALVTEADLEELMRSFLFAQGNLMNQIGNNSRIIGYNRATQLYEKIQENKTDFGYITLYKNYASLIDMVSSTDSIFSYWAFNYSRRKGVGFSIVDISKNGYDLTTNKSSNLYPQSFDGFMSMLDFSTPNYYKLSSQVPLSLIDTTTESDIPFTMIFAVEPIGTGRKTLLAKVNKATGTYTFQIQELPNGSLEVILYSDVNNYLKFTSDTGVIPKEAHSLVLTYAPRTRSSEAEMLMFVNSSRYELNLTEEGTYTYMKELPGTLYEFSCTPFYQTYIRKTGESVGTPQYSLCYQDGTTYTSEDWVITIEGENVSVEYDGATATNDPSQDSIINLWKWSYSNPELQFDESVYTTDDPESITSDTKLYTEFYTPYEGDNFEIGTGGDKVVCVYGGTPADTTPSDTPTPYVIQYYSYSKETQYAWTNNKTAPTVLYIQTSDGNFEPAFEDSKWKIKDNKIYYDNQEASDANTSTQTFYPDLTSYIIDTDGSLVDNIDSKVGLVAIIKEKVPEETARALALNLCATMGKNPYMSTN